MAIVQRARLHEEYRRQKARLQVGIEVGRVLDHLPADRRILHDRSLVLERITDVAIDIGRRRGILGVLVPALAIPAERYRAGQQHVADAWRRDRRDGVGVLRVDRAVAVIAGIVVVQQVIVAVLAVQRDRRLQRLQVFGDRADAGLAGVGAGAVGSAGIAVLGVIVVGAGLRVGVLDLVGRRLRRRSLCRRCTRWRRQIRP